MRKGSDRGCGTEGLRLFCSAFLLLLLAGASGCRAQQQPWPLWEAYTGRYLDQQGRVIDRSAGDRTTSEGEAYAMFFALVDNDRAHFDKLLDWTEANLAGGDLTLRLPAWEWGKNANGEWKTIDDNPATDADLWMAYSLMEAGRLWHEPRYDKLGRLMAARIAQKDVVLIDGVGTTLIAGPVGFHPDPQSWVLNPSYLPLPVLTYFAKTMPQGPWRTVIDSMPALVGGAASHGYAMDWVQAGPDGVHPVAAPAEPTAGAKEAQAAGSYDAIRVYLWLGIADPGTAGVRELLGQLGGMKGTMQTGVTPPLEVGADGTMVRADAPVGFSAALVPFLQAVGSKAAAKLQQDRVVALRESATGLYGRPAEYYDQNLVLFSTGWSEQRYRFERDGKLRIKW